MVDSAASESNEDLTMPPRHARSILPILCIGCVLVWSFPLGSSAATGTRGGRQDNADALRIIVIDGDEAANIVAERLAVEPVIEVRDRENRRVPGAVVRFFIRRAMRGGKEPATFGNGGTEMRVLTDAAGRASVDRLVVVEPGPFEIEVQASHQGRTASATIRQTNFPTAADARAEGRTPGQSAGTQTTATGAGTGSGAGAGAAGAAAGASAGAGAAAAGGGLSKVLVGSLIAAGAAGGVATVLARRGEPNAEPAVDAISVSRSTSIVNVPIVFSAPATDRDGNQLSYRWDFGDGRSSSAASPVYAYQSAGVFGVSVTVSDGEATVTRETSVTIKSLTGRWISDDFDSSAFPGGPLFRTTEIADLTQSGSVVSGTVTIVGRPPQWDPGPVPVAGNIGGQVSPVLRMSGRFDVPIPSIIIIEADPDPSGDVLIGRGGFITYRRQ
jgi:hypothetical protein